MMLHLRVIYVRQFLLISLNAEQRILFYNADEKVLDSFILPLLLISVGALWGGALLTSTAVITIVIINLRQIHGVQSLIARSSIGLRNRLLWWILWSCLNVQIAIIRIVAGHSARVDHGIGCVIRFQDSQRNIPSLALATHDRVIENATARHEGRHAHVDQRHRHTDPNELLRFQIGRLAIGIQGGLRANAPLPLHRFRRVLGVREPHAHVL